MSVGDITKYRQQMADNPNDRRHGTTTGYVYGCRCERCVEASRAAWRRSGERRRLRRLAEKPKRKTLGTVRAKAYAGGAGKKDICTVDQLQLPMMGRPSIKFDPPRCAICGRTWPLNNHHIVKRSAGVLVVNGVEAKKPTVMLCGSGNTSGCHGLAHQQRLHFRWVEAACEHDGTDWAEAVSGLGHWEYLLTEKPTRYEAALAMAGWRSVCAL